MSSSSFKQFMFFSESEICLRWKSSVCSRGSKLKGCKDAGSGTKQMEQVAGQQARRRVCVAWYETSQSRFPSPPSFTRTVSLCRPCHNIKPPQTFSSRKLFQPPCFFLSFFLFLSSEDKLKCGWTLSEDFKTFQLVLMRNLAAGRGKKTLFNHHHNLRSKLSFKEELAALTNKGRQEGGAKKASKSVFHFFPYPVTHHYCRTVEKNLQMALF